ncbi:MAG: 2-isopropylmalate synthase [Cystobacterineae bacterium]|nr:2-isopropylmalate synthase [Cystobacterineae bacterium]
MLANPASKYCAFQPIRLHQRQWPDVALSRPPIWMSTDLRDGNQALFEPMDVQRKLRLFHLLCNIGFKEIEVGFPSASQVDFDFVRCLIEGGHIPEDVSIEVLSHARTALIERSMASLRGARRAIVHVCNAIAPAFRENVFGMKPKQIVKLTTSATSLVRQLAQEMAGTKVLFQYSPETFSGTELEFSLEVCNAVTETWGARPDDKVILNLPASVEMATPNHYADQIEWMHRHLARRDSVVLSVHTHNDRGTGVAAAELALMAGAERVEGCLFGNGERTGNVDIVTLALNLYGQGVSPGLDFSDIGSVARIFEACTGMPIHPRHPYAGELVFTAFSGSHQDAIKKGLAAQRKDAPWKVPYLLVDPADIGRNYDALIRVNSQSGKGGCAWLLQTHYGISMPRKLQAEFSLKVQKEAEKEGEVSAEHMWRIFSQTYVEPASPLRYVSHRLNEEGAVQGVELVVEMDGRRHVLCGHGNGPIDAAVHALRSAGIVVRVQSFEEQSLSASREGGEARACAFLLLAGETGDECYGAGVDENIVTASLRALLSGVNRLIGGGFCFFPSGGGRGPAARLFSKE